MYQSYTWTITIPEITEVKITNCRKAMDIIEVSSGSGMMNDALSEIVFMMKLEIAIYQQSVLHGCQACCFTLRSEDNHATTDLP